MPYADCYDGAPARCSGGPRPGTIVLSEYVMDEFPGVGTFGIYDCRPNTGDPDQLSIHSDGRAWDAAIALDADGLALGNKVAAWLVANHEILGVQLVIWNRRDWNVVRGTWDSYGGPNPHRDHIHNEQCLAAANTLTRADLDAAFAPVTMEDDDMQVLYVKGTTWRLYEGGKLFALKGAGVVEAYKAAGIPVCKIKHDTDGIAHWNQLHRTFPLVSVAS